MSQNLVPDRELCERLKELGMPQQTQFIWFYDGAETWKILFVGISILGPSHLDNLMIAAPTVGELGEMLPAYLPNHQDPIERLESWKDDDGYFNEYGRDASPQFSDLLKEANTRARLLIWCAENGHVKWDESF